MNAERSERRELYLGFLPWVVFVLVCRGQSGSVVWAALAAIGTVVMVSSPSLRRPALKGLEWTALAWFTSMLVGALVVGPDPDRVLQHYGRGISMIGLAAITLGSLFFVPVTEDYYRDAVRPRYWTTPRFRSVNRRLTFVWGLAFVAMAACNFVANYISTWWSVTIFTWIVPIAISVAVITTVDRWWHEYHDEHVSAYDGAMNEMAVLESLFLMPEQPHPHDPFTELDDHAVDLTDRL
jgi:hypothetical protein